jgi:sugar phosphate isomerase/epimerase
MRRRELKPSKPLTAWDILAKVRQWGLKGAQVEILSMPKLGTGDFEAFRKAVAKAKVYWEVSAGSIQNEKGVLQAIDYNLALGSTVIRSFMEVFSIQLKDISLDDYVSDAIRHIENVLPKFEQHGLHLCLENHGGLRTKYMRRVLKTFPSEHLGVNLDTGNAILTLEDPVEVARELAPRAYTCHLKDWNLLRSDDGIVVRGCALGDGVVDLKAILDILRAGANTGAGMATSREARWSTSCVCWRSATSLPAAKTVSPPCAASRKA